jgi:hypothetical protein
MFRKGVALMKKSVKSKHEKRLLIMKKIIHSNVRLLKSEIIDSFDWKTKASAAKSCVELLGLLEWKEILKESVIKQEGSK